MAGITHDPRETRPRADRPPGIVSIPLPSVGHWMEPAARIGVTDRNR
jgi:hypothetical protein